MAGFRVTAGFRVMAGLQQVFKIDRISTFAERSRDGIWGCVGGHGACPFRRLRRPWQ